MIFKVACMEAWQMVAAAVERGATFSVLNKYAGTIIVLDPSCVYGVDDLKDAILYQRRVEEDHPDADKYDEIALAKAAVSYRTGLSSRQVQQEAPHLYIEGDTKWGGSVVRHGLIVAFSGVQAVFDEMIAGWMADAVIACCRNEMTKVGGVMASEGSFIEPR